MRVLLVNNHHKNLGGAEKYYFDLAKLLEKKGHKVAFFSTKDPQNIPSKWAKYFVTKLDFSENTPKSFYSKLANMFYSFVSKRNISKLLDNFKPDIVHIQNIYYYISPSILSEIKRRNIPIVQTVHDYQLVTPTVTFFHNGKICEVTKKHSYYKAVFHRCVKDSYGASLMAVIASYTQRLFGFYEKYVDLFIAPSMFMKNKLIEYGFDADRVIYIPNFIDTQPTTHNIQPTTNKRYVLFFGRLLEHKGVGVLLSTAQRLPKVRFKIAGDGPAERRLKKTVKELKLNNVDFLGRLNGNDLRQTISKASFCVVPSLWYENMPYSVLESFSFGKPVITSRIGGIPELVNDGKNGFLFRPGDVKGLCSRVLELWNNQKLQLKMGIFTRQMINERFSAGIYYGRLLSIYKKAINNYQ